MKFSLTPLSKFKSSLPILLSITILIPIPLLLWLGYLWQIAPGMPFLDLLSVEKKTFVVLGDPQQTSWWETTFLQRSNNRKVTTRLFQFIAAEQPDFVALLGDLVFYGANHSNWTDFDLFAQPLQKRGIPTLTVLGNHDYFGPDSIALANVYSRFPQLSQQHWYLRIYGSLALIFLDSNQSAMPPSHWQKQIHWLKNTLTSLEQNPRIQAILFLAHHSPYTNDLYSPDAQHLRPWLNLFFSSPKSILFLSGHCHGYEHFVKQKKHFVVSAGGGGPRKKHLQGPNQRHPDLYTGPYPRPFHYLRLQLQKSHLHIQAMGLFSNSLRCFDEFSIPLPTTPQ
ncbi:MAG: hypothetical protein D6805_04875 [Planctomycetota bacterium]|nr:MAG: hypothetical protein D6805_04875 [Planctomycetota bacterium]